MRSATGEVPTVIDEKTHMPLGWVLGLCGSLLAFAVGIGAAHVRQENQAVRQDAIEARQTTFEVETRTAQKEAAAKSHALELEQVGVRSDVRSINANIIEINQTLKDMQERGIRPARGGR